MHILRFTFHICKQKPQVRMENRRLDRISKISVIIAKEMHLFGTSSLNTKVIREAALVTEFMLRAVGMRFLNGGAVAERTTTLGSDADRLLVLPDMTLCEGEDGCPADLKGHIFEMESADCSPGYSKLKLLKRKENDLDFFTAFKSNLDNFIVQKNHANYLSSEKFSTSFIFTGNESCNENVANFFRHGPCSSTFLRDTIGHMFGKPVELQSDLAYGIPCLEWPKEAMEWITRDRRFGWPMPETIDRIVTQECHAVPVGDSSSIHADLEWRVSFLAGERELIWTFNDVQLQCYVILKNILKGEIDQIAPDEISSFHLKTIMFWLSEENSEELWAEENLIQCVKMGLKELKSGIEKGQISHYFARKRNLLASKFSSRTTKENTLMKIEYILCHTIETVLKGPGCETLLKLWTSCKGNESIFITLNDGFEDLYLVAKKEKESLGIFRSLFSIYEMLVDYPFELKDMLHITLALHENPPDDVGDVFLENFVRFVNVRLGITFFKHEQECIDHMERLACFIKGREILGKGSECDALTGNLYIATFDMQCGKVEKCLQVVKETMQTTSYICYPGWCSKNRGIINSNEVLQQVLEMPNLNEPTEKSVGFDIIFNYSDIDFVPYILKFECVFHSGLSSSFHIHPLVYTYYLLFICAFKLKMNEEAITFVQCLRKTVDDCKGGIERDRAFNILGYCFTLLGKDSEAFDSFVMSLLETPQKDASKTVALYHLAIIAFDEHKRCAEVTKSERYTVLYSREN